MGALGRRQFVRRHVPERRDQRAVDVLAIVELRSVRELAELEAQPERQQHVGDRRRLRADDLRQGRVYGRLALVEAGKELGPPHAILVPPEVVVPRIVAREDPLNRWHGRRSSLGWLSSSHVPPSRRPAPIAW